MTRPRIQRFAVHAMATRFEVVVEASFDAGPAFEAARAEIEEGHARLTRFERASFVSHLNRTLPERPVRLDLDLAELFEVALGVERATAGAFSPTPGRPGCLALDGDGHLAATTGVREVAVDLGAIAKGHALDLAGRALREAGVERALLHGGTSTVLALGGPFRIGLRDGGTFDLEDAALSTSAQTRGERAGERTYHVTDARSGTPAPDHVATVAIAPTATLADAWSTAALALHPTPAPRDVLAASGVRLLTTSPAPTLPTPCSDPTAATS